MCSGAGKGSACLWGGSVKLEPRVPQDGKCKVGPVSADPAWHTQHLPFAFPVAGQPLRLCQRGVMFAFIPSSPTNTGILVPICCFLV